MTLVIGHRDRPGTRWADPDHVVERVADLRHSAAPLRIAPLAEVVCLTPVGVVTFRILGAAHQVVLEPVLADGMPHATVAVHETLASETCLRRGDPRVDLVAARLSRFPARRRTCTSTGCLELRAEVVRAGSDPGGADAEEVLGSAAAEATTAVESAEECAVAVRFLGAPDALSAIVLEPTVAGRRTALAWSSWHLYPASGEVVRTRTTWTLNHVLDDLAAAGEA